MKIKFELAVKDTNVILNALAKRPFEEVHEVIGEIMRQGNSQLKPADSDP